MQLRRPPLTEDALEAVLHRARTVGFLGPGPIRFHVNHAMAFADALPDDVASFVDIGSGGGVPGLPVALVRPGLQGILLDASQKRTAFLVWAVAELGLSDRVQVVTGRAEDVARDPAYREAADAIVSRGFGPPAMTVECASGLVRTGGVIVISEPPVRRLWPADGLAKVGLVQQPADDEADTPNSPVDADDLNHKVVVFKRTRDLSETYPRAARFLKRDPLFDLD